SDLVTALVTEPFSTVSTGSVISPVGCNASGGSRSAPLSARATSAAAITAQMTIRAGGKTYWRTTPMGFLAAGKWRLHGGSLATLVQADGAAGRKQGVKRRGPRTGRCGALGVRDQAAGADGGASRNAGAVSPASTKAPATAATTVSTSERRTRAIALPPNPPPVMR